MVSKRLVEVIAVLFFVLSVIWLLVAMQAGVLPVQPSQDSGTGVVKLMVIKLPNQEGAVVKLNVLSRGG